MTTDAPVRVHQSALLRVSDVTKRFGGVLAVRGCSLALEAQSTCGLIGPNGSGKTTLFNIITGLYHPDSGAIAFRGQRIDGLPAYRIAEQGVGRTFQIIRVFPKMTVMENMLAVSRDSNPARKAKGLLEMVGLTPLSNEYAGNLSYGQQKLLEFARVLMRDPALIMLDEPFAGVNPTMENILIAHIKALREKGTTFLIIDHEMKIIMSLCDRIFVLDHGELIAQGLPADIQNNERVLEAYFGR
ncbi:MAG: ABC transporter ATP-binding protein [Chloroflexi bacterium]|nr:ABC transporter ATP-binding protein [Chloroflexota bacterium]